MLQVRIEIRSTNGAALRDGSLVAALEQRNVRVRGAEITPRGLNILCEADVRTLRLCAEHLASLSFVAGVSMQRSDTRA
jgi:hypothetical protein